MPIPISQTVKDALGGSFIWEEHLGNLSQARILAQKDFQNAETQQELAKAHFSLGVVHLLSGQLRSAGRHWGKAEALGEKSADWVLLLAAFRHLADYERWNTKLDGTAAEALEINARWDVQTVMGVNIPHLNQLRETCPDLEAQNLAWFLNEIFGTGKSIRSTAQHWLTAPFAEEAKALFWQVLQNMERSAVVAIKEQLTDYTILPFWLRADIFWRSKHIDLAKEALHKAIEIAQTQNDNVRLANCLLTQGDWLAAPFSTPLAWDFALFDSSLEHSGLAGQVESHEFSPVSPSVLKTAKDLYEQALQLYTQATAQRGMAQAHLRLAFISIRADNWNKAQELVQIAENLFRESGDFRGVMLSRTHHILIHLWKEEWLSLQDAASIIGRWGRRSGDFSYIHSLGILINRFARHLFLRHGRYEAARIAYQTASNLFEALQAPMNAIQNQVDRALLNEAVGDFTTATPEILGAAKRYLQLVKEPPAYWSQPEVMRPVLLQHAIMLTSQAYNISNSLMDWEQMISARQQVIRFIKLLNPGGELPTKIPETLEEMRLLGLTQLALSLDREASVLIPYYQYKKKEQKNDSFSATHHWKAALAAAEKLPQDRCLFYQTVLWGAKRDYPTANKYFQEYLQLQQSVLPPLSERFDSKSPFLDKDDLDLIKHRNFWEQTFSMNVKLCQYDEALKAWQQRCKLQDDSWWEREHSPWRTGSAVAEMYEQLGDYSLALQFCERSLSMLDQRRNELSRDELRTAIANDRGAQFLYHQGARLAIRQHDPEKAFYYIEQGKARALLDLLSAHPDRLSLKNSQRLYVQQWREGNAKLQAFRGLLAIERRRVEPDPTRVQQLETDLNATTLSVQKIEKVLIREIPGFFSTIGGDGKILTTNQVKELLEEGQLFIAYSYYEEDLFIWAINHNGLVHSSLQQVPIRTLRNLSLDLHHACQARSAYEEPAASLARYLLEPIKEELKQHDQVYITPSGTLFLVPFQILPFQNKPLAESHLLSFLPSASSLQYFSAIELRPDSPMLVVGNPTGDLQAASVEASFIAELFKTQALLGAAATEAAVRKELPQAEILHLATHGFLSEEAPLSSSLALAGETQLSLYELMGMQLRAELVVLSACETGKGNTTSGDDVVGLTRGLLAAGAKSAIVSFWPVDDTSTALLMKHFYQHLKKHHSPARALTFAQNQLRQTSEKVILQDLKEGLAALPITTQRSLRGIKLERSEADVGYEHPFYWAPFFYVGRL